MSFILSDKHQTFCFQFKTIKKIEIPTSDSPQFFFVYILMCNDGKPYTVCIADLIDRLNRHNRGSAPATKKNRRPMELITYIAFNDKYRAFEYEKCLKPGSGRAVLRKCFI